MARKRPHADNWICSRCRVLAVQVAQSGGLTDDFSLARRFCQSSREIVTGIAEWRTGRAKQTSCLLSLEEPELPPLEEPSETVQVGATYLVLLSGRGLGEGQGFTYM